MINQAACNIAKTVAKEQGTITAGGISMTDVYAITRNKEQTIAALNTSTKVLIDNDVDMLICEVCTCTNIILSNLDEKQKKKKEQYTIPIIKKLQSFKNDNQNCGLNSFQSKDGAIIL